MMFTQQAGNPEELFTGAKSSSEENSFLRHVIHPHGALNFTGISILTTRDYLALNGSLAYRIATHASFASNLVIVGMSLNDEYLRDQIVAFRSQIRSIVWVTMPISDDMKLWAWENNVIVAIFEDIDEFWSDIVDKSILDLPLFHRTFRRLRFELI